MFQQLRAGDGVAVDIYAYRRGLPPIGLKSVVLWIPPGLDLLVFLYQYFRYVVRFKRGWVLEVRAAASDASLVMQQYENRVAAATAYERAVRQIPTLVSSQLELALSRSEV